MAAAPTRLHNSQLGVQPAGRRPGSLSCQALLQQRQRRLMLRLLLASSGGGAAASHRQRGGAITARAGAAPASHQPHQPVAKEEQRVVSCHCQGGQLHQQVPHPAVAEAHFTTASIAAAVNRAGRQRGWAVVHLQRELQGRAAALAVVPPAAANTILWQRGQQDRLLATWQKRVQLQRCRCELRSHDK